MPSRICYSAAMARGISRIERHRLGISPDMLNAHADWLLAISRTTVTSVWSPPAGYHLRLYRNTAPSEGNHWLSIHALTGKRGALGARLELRAGEHRWTQLILAAYSFLSSNDPRAHFGLGSIDRVDSLSLADGTRETFEVPGVDRQLTIRQGEGRKQGGSTPLKK